MHKKRVETKYVIITLALAGSLFLLASNYVFDGLEQPVNTMMNGLVGMARWVRF